MVGAFLLFAILVALVVVFTLAAIPTGDAPAGSATPSPVVSAEH